MILIIDNYDSFTYNIAQYVGEISDDIHIFKNDNIGVSDIEDLNCSHIISETFFSIILYDFFLFNME